MDLQFETHEDRHQICKIAFVYTASNHDAVMC